MLKFVNRAVVEQRGQDKTSTPDADPLFRKLDFFPTPPWAVRAVMPFLAPYLPTTITMKDPSAGAGHLIYGAASSKAFKHVEAQGTDIHDYGFGYAYQDMLTSQNEEHDLVITNPPFPFAARYAHRVLTEWERPPLVFAMLVRNSWLEGVGRYDKIFGNPKTRPTANMVFCERVPMVLGRYDPDASTATAYSWIVWSRLLQGDQTRTIWIPPGQKKSLFREVDRDVALGWSATGHSPN
ncbi:hypothetical protein [Roseococcus pinisoli]|uniref:Methyltransferase n=1 Tax=Roseococcus pinisoli TaxID=2835040 RepID=A0ABS5QIE3_9PROT|nr:hypothetical protein [Roseococcus pinisoli]MBS7812313.1 hypothetical protein [Roseococcus pinisoli]